MADFTSTSRSQKDFYTNPNFGATLQMLEQMIDAETTKMRTAMRGSDVTSINRAAGVVDGIELAMRRLQQERENAMTSDIDEPVDAAYAVDFDAQAQS